MLIICDVSLAMIDGFLVRSSRHLCPPAVAGVGVGVLSGVLHLSGERFTALRPRPKPELFLMIVDRCADVIGLGKDGKIARQ